MAPSERITIGQIGCGSRGSGQVSQFMNMEGAQVVAVCDVDRSRCETNQRMVNGHYGETLKGGAFRGCDAFNDFRDLLARPDIDAVGIATPDHWHALTAIAACKAGKDIYCEKPLSLTVEQGRAMSDAVRKYGRVFQTGSQLRSIEGTRHGCELVRNGYIGELKTIHCTVGRSPTLDAQAEMPVPDGFDYDFWLGPAPWAPYTEKRCFNTFRFNLDYSGGEITDHGAHAIDLGQWGHGSTLTGPVEFEGEGEFPREGLFNTATRFEARCTYADGVTLIVASDGPFGTSFFGTEGHLSVYNGMDVANPPSLRHVKIKPNEDPLYVSRNHNQDFLDCIRTRQEPVAPVEQAHRSVTISHIGNIAMRLGRQLRWNPDKERFVNDPEADRMLSRPMRAPWTL